MPLCKRFERELVPEWRLHCVDYRVSCCGLRLALRSTINLIAQHVTLGACLAALRRVIVMYLLRGTGRDVGADLGTCNLAGAEKASRGVGRTG
jgi:hypothetical protein